MPLTWVLACGSHEAFEISRPMYLSDVPEYLDNAKDLDETGTKQKYRCEKEKCYT
jgi:hypothetical protein